MSKIFVFLLSMTLFQVGFDAMAQKKPADIPLEDFFRNAERTQYQISPDGKAYAWLAPFQNRMNIHYQRVEGGEPMRVTAVTDRDIPAFFWKGQSLLYVIDKGGNENFQLIKVDPLTKKTTELTSDSSVTDIMDDLEGHPTDILIQNNERNPEIFDVYRVNTKTGEVKMILENPGNHSSWLADHAGVIRITLTTDGVNSSFLYRDSAAEPFREVFKTNFREGVNPLLFTPDNSMVYASSNRNRDKSAIVVLDPRTGKENKLIYEHPSVDVSNVGYSYKRKIVTHVSYQFEKREIEFLDPEYKAMYGEILGSLKGYEVAITSRDEAENMFIVRTYSDRSLGSFYLYNKSKKLLNKIGDVSPWINEQLMGEMKPITFKTRDGMTLHGYLTLPKGGGKNLPIVVNPHGGPWARDFWGFNPEIQFLVSRGYGVLQINFRGSTGFGRKYWESSFKEWGKKMQDDITDGVNWLIKEGIANPKKIGIYGGSYGGYATLAGLAFTPDLYACGVDYVGVSNLFTFMKTIPPYWKPYLEMMYEMVGNPETDKAMFEAASPALQVDKIKAPLFVAQGRNDPRVNIDESDQIVKALKAKGIDVPYMVKDNEGHGFRNQENKYDFYRAMERFFAKYLKDEKIEGPLFPEKAPEKPKMEAPKK